MIFEINNNGNIIEIEEEFINAFVNHEVEDVFNGEISYRDGFFMNTLPDNIEIL